jgi:hypothetical protein
MLQAGNTNYSLRDFPSFGWVFKPLRHNPYLSFVSNGVGSENLVAALYEDRDLENALYGIRLLA